MTRKRYEGIFNYLVSSLLGDEKLLLSESISGKRKSIFSNIPDELFTKAIESDPTYIKNSDNEGEYTLWVLKLVKNGLSNIKKIKKWEAKGKEKGFPPPSKLPEITEEELDKGLVKNTLERFDSAKNYIGSHKIMDYSKENIKTLSSRDIDDFASLSDVRKELASVYKNGFDRKQHQKKIKLQINELYSLFKKAVERGMEIVFNDKNWLVGVPLTKESSVIFAEAKERDDDGNIVPKKKYGEIQYQTDEDGNFIKDRNGNKIPIPENVISWCTTQNSKFYYEYYTDRKNLTLCIALNKQTGDILQCAVDSKGHFVEFNDAKNTRIDQTNFFSKQENKKLEQAFRYASSTVANKKLKKYKTEGFETILDSESYAIGKFENAEACIEFFENNAKVENHRLGDDDRNFEENDEVFLKSNKVFKIISKLAPKPYFYVVYDKNARLFYVYDAKKDAMTDSLGKNSFTRTMIGESQGDVQAFEFLTNETKKYFIPIYNKLKQNGMISFYEDGDVTLGNFNSSIGIEQYFKVRPNKMLKNVLLEHFNLFPSEVCIIVNKKEANICFLNLLTYLRGYLYSNDEIYGDAVSFLNKNEKYIPILKEHYFSSMGQEREELLKDSKIALKNDSCIIFKISSSDANLKNKLAILRKVGIRVDYDEVKDTYITIANKSKEIFTYNILTNDFRTITNQSGTYSLKNENKDFVPILKNLRIKVLFKRYKQIVEKCGSVVKNSNGWIVAKIEKEEPILQMGSEQFSDFVLFPQKMHFHERNLTEDCYIGFNKTHGEISFYSSGGEIFSSNVSFQTNETENHQNIFVEMCKTDYFKRHSNEVFKKAIENGMEVVYDGDSWFIGEPKTNDSYADFWKMTNWGQFLKNVLILWNKKTYELFKIEAGQLMSNPIRVHTSSGRIIAFKKFFNNPSTKPIRKVLYDLYHKRMQEIDSTGWRNSESETYFEKALKFSGLEYDEKSQMLYTDVYALNPIVPKNEDGFFSMEDIVGALDELALTRHSQSVEDTHREILANLDNLNNTETWKRLVETPYNISFKDFYSHMNSICRYGHSSNLKFVNLFTLINEDLQKNFAEDVSKHLARTKSKTQDGKYWEKLDIYNFLKRYVQSCVYGGIYNYVLSHLKKYIPTLKDVDDDDRILIKISPKLLRKVVLSSQTETPEDRFKASTEQSILETYFKVALKNKDLIKIPKKKLVLNPQQCEKLTAFFAKRLLSLIKKYGAKPKNTQND